MAKDPSIRSVRMNARYAKLRKRVKEDYGLPTLTAADAFIAAYFEDYERQKALIFGNNSKPSPKKMAEEVSNILYGGGFV